MFLVLTFLLLTSWSGGGVAQEPDQFQAGIYADLDRTVTCISGQAGDSFEQAVWAWVPAGQGLRYITLRVASPENLDLTARPQYNSLITQVIRTEYADSTEEWNLLFAQCPSGWVLVFTQEITLLDDQPGEIAVEAEHSMARDCSFLLNDVLVLNDLGLNDPDCEFLPASSIAWDGLKGLFR